MAVLGSRSLPLMGEGDRANGVVEWVMARCGQFPPACHRAGCPAKTGRKAGMTRAGVSHPSGNKAAAGPLIGVKPDPEMPT